MTVGSKVVWENPNGGETVTTIIKAEKNEELVISLYLSRWEVQLNEGDVAYRYKLKEQDGGTI
ncbi:hypothetical protein [Ornithinibacillus halotolerans]|uniref:Uncharacterized protein n=1 Tax=Ornithinibacillus halotolerans TaxID=1274357 RepID=A0A916WA34_9BACI|nr:hypothetical protein [Ornithinibacillus halotolerans]GGA79409.1 hypothetical protein GCM10008025_23520 [Ornithinibacillus halotolerans]